MPDETKRSLWSRLLDAYVDVAFRRPFVLLLVMLLAGAGAAFYASGNIKVVTDLGALLPEGTRSVAALDESRQRIGSTDFFVIAISSESRDKTALAGAQDALKAAIEQEWEDAEWAQVARDTTFFREHALYFFTEEKLAELKEILDLELVRASAALMPGMVDLMDDGDGDEQPDLATRIKGWLDMGSLKSMGLPPQIEKELHGIFTEDKQPVADKAEGDPAAATAPTVSTRDRMIGPEGDVGVVMVQLAKPSTDMDYARFALNRGTELIARTPAIRDNADLEAQVVGAYRSFHEVDTVANDGLFATVVSVTLILVFVSLFFGSPRAVISVFVPLAVAGSLTMALAAVSFGRLTALTVFVLAMLAGMGIDYGIHLYGRIISEARGGAGIRDATATAIKDAGSAVAAAAITTIASLMGLEVAHFEGFREFGIIASFGLTFCLGCSLFVLPPLVAAMERVRPYGGGEGVRSAGVFAALGERLRLDAKRAAPAAFILAMGATVALGYYVPQVEFEHDFRNLRSPKTRNTIGYGRAVGKNASTAPAVLLGRDRAQMETAHEILLSRLRLPTLQSFITVRTFVPLAAEQQARQKVIEEIAVIANKRAMRKQKDTTRVYVDELRTMSAAEPFDVDDVPAWARRIVTERDGTVGSIGHLYARVKNWDAISVSRFKDDFDNLVVHDKPLPIASSSFILSDVVRMVKADGGRLLAVVFGVLAVILALFSRSARGAVVLIASVVISALWTVGIMGAFGIRIGLYNIVVIPVVLGVSIDTAIHLYHRHRSLGAAGMGENLRTTGMMVTASSFTTICGFTGLLFVSHLGLRTIGVLALVGVGASWLAMLLVLPFLLMRFVPQRPARD